MGRIEIERTISRRGRGVRGGLFLQHVVHGCAAEPPRAREIGCVGFCARARTRARGLGRVRGQRIFAMSLDAGLRCVSGFAECAG